MSLKDAHIIQATSPATSMEDDGALADTSMTMQDLKDMAEQGKRQQFTRNFGFISMLGFATTMMCTWEAVFLSNLTAMVNGGGPSVVYGFLFSWVGTLATGASLAELASMAPTSGGQYHWVSMLAPDNCKVFLSWFTGWVATIGWNANTAAGIFFTGAVTQGLLVLNYPDYVYARWQGTLMMYAALLVVFLVNTVAARLLPKIEGVILIIHTLGFFAILIPLVYLSDHNTASFVFQEFQNLAGYKSGGAAFFVGLISSNLPFIGYDGPCHMSEEVKNAAVVVPKVIMYTILINGTLGLAVSIAFAFCITDVQDAVVSATGFDFIPVFFNATQSHAGTSIMAALLVVLTCCASFGFLASASRQTWAFARDRGLPFSDWLVHVSKRGALPIHSIIICAIITILICLINVGSTVAFNAIVGITISGLFTSYLIPIVLFAMRKVDGSPIRYGPWKMGRTLGLAVNCVSIIYLTISIIFSFFPPVLPVTPLSMNWAIVVWGGLVLIGLVFWVVRGRKIYHGPIVERPILPSELQDQKL